jgi:hypothetical protein
MKLTEFPKEGCVQIYAAIKQDLVKYLQTNGRKYSKKSSNYENYVVWDKDKYWYTSYKSTNKVCYEYEAISEYITTKPSLVGRYLKVLKKFSIHVEIGEYLLITEEKPFTVSTTKYGTTSRQRFEDGDPDLQLMPEGFEPNVVEPKPKIKYKFKVGDKVKIKTSGLGYDIDCKGEVVEILELGVYDKNPGYKTTIPSKGWCNAKSGSYKCMADEESFELYEEPKYKYEVVHCTTQEEWDFVCGKISYFIDGEWNFYKENSCINLREPGYSRKGFYEEQKSLIYTFQEWCTKFNHTYPVKEEFEVGKWYKYNNHIGKLKEITSERLFRASEYIVDDYYYNSEGNWGYPSSHKLLTDLTEIQQYLPDGHVDKTWIPKVGDWVVIIIPHNNINWNPGMDRYVGKSFQLDKLTSSKCGYYNIEGNSWIWEYSERTKHFRKATEYEIPVTTTEVVKLYEALPIPNSTEYFYARVTKDIIKKKLEERWRSLPEVIPKGSITWFHVKYLLFFKNKKDTVHPESNRWCANIPVEYFEVIDTSLLTKNEVKSVDEVNVPECIEEPKKSNKLVRLTIFTPSTPVLEKENSISLLNIKSIKKLF